MKNLYSSILIVIVALFVFVPLAGAVADNGHPAWNKQINNSGRFKVLSQFGNAAVFDKETGLVWEQSPDTSTRNWFNSHEHCLGRVVGNRRGWRLPTAEELASLFDPAQPDPSLPSGHPFSDVQSTGDTAYWAATTFVSDTSQARAVIVDGGGMGFAPKGATVNAGFSFFTWCVRGGQGVDTE